LAETLNVPETAEKRSLRTAEFNSAASTAGDTPGFDPVASSTMTWFSAMNPRRLCFFRNAELTGAAFSRRCWSRLLVRCTSTDADFVVNAVWSHGTQYQRGFFDRSPPSKEKLPSGRTHDAHSNGKAPLQRDVLR